MCFNIYDNMKLKDYRIRLLHSLICLYLATLFFILTDLVSGTKLLDYRFHLGLIAIAAFGSMFRCFLDNIGKSDEGK